jgi:hypothetical protein
VAPARDRTLGLVTAEGGGTVTGTPHRRLRDHAPEVLIEGFTMTLYVSLSLLAVVVAMPVDPAQDTAADLARIVLLTCAGLVLAHLFAFRLSSRLVQGELPAEHPSILLAQVVGGLAVGVIAAVPVLVLGVEPGAVVADALLLGIVALAGYTVARRARMSRTRTVGYVLTVVVGVMVILAVKAAAGH